MAKLSLPLATATILSVALVGLPVLTGDGEIVQAQEKGNLLLDWAIDDNTPTSVGMVDVECRTFAAGALVKIDAIAVDAVDWAAIDFIIEYPSPAVVSAPGPGDGQEDGAFDFVPFAREDPTDSLGAQNFMFPDSADANADYSTGEPVTDGLSPHGISMFDNSLAGNSGSGGMARISLDTSGLAPGVYTLSLGVTGHFAGAVHSDASVLQLDNFGSVYFAIETDCISGTPTPAPPEPTPETGGAAPDGGDSDGISWLIVGLAAGGVVAAVATIGAISLRLRRRAGNK